MMSIFTKGLPRNVTKLLEQEYTAQLSQIKFLADKYRNQYDWIDRELETVEMILALAIFYKIVLAPCFSTVEIFNQHMSQAIPVTRFVAGSGKNQKTLLDADTASQFESMERRFLAIIRRFSLSLANLNYENLEDFLNGIMPPNQDAPKEFDALPPLDE